MNDEIRCAVELRADERGKGRGAWSVVSCGTASGRLTGRELFEPGALSWPDDGVVLNRQHARGQPIMRVLPVRVGDELRIDQPLPDTLAGRDAAQKYGLA